MTRGEKVLKSIVDVVDFQTTKEKKAFKRIILKIRQNKKFALDLENMLDKTPQGIHMEEKKKMDLFKEIKKWHKPKTRYERRTKRWEKKWKV